MTKLGNITSLQPLSAPNRAGQTKPHIQSLHRQSGGVIVLILAFAAVLSVGLIMIYNTTQQVVAKRELVNAADASAYSGAAIIAQGLNYTASTNRAILANNALVGQMMSIRSTLAMSEWYWKSNSRMWKAFAALVQWVPYLGSFMEIVSEGFTVFSKVMGQSIHVMRNLAELLQVTSTAAINLTNTALYLSQQVHLADSLVMFSVHMRTIAAENAPNARVDEAYYNTFFGPVVTAGTLAANLKLKIRKNEQTFDDLDKNKKDEYLNYVTEVNRNVHTAAYVGGRSLMPNAVSLWIAPPGCNLGEEYLNSPNYAPAAGLNPIGDVLVDAINLLKPLVGMIGEKYFCMHERQGGAELVQLSNGRMAWLSADAIAVNVPLLPPDMIEGVRLTNLPMASGGAMSFGESTPGKNQQTLDKFKAYITKNEPGHFRNGNYLGHQVALPADCVEYMVPGSNPDMRAISLDTRTSGNCAVLASGLEDKSRNKGLWAGNLSEATERLFEDTPELKVGQAAIKAAIMAQLQTILGKVESEMTSVYENVREEVTPDFSGVTAPPPPGVSSCTNCASASMANVSKARDAGTGFLNSNLVTAKNLYKQKLKAFALSSLDPNKLKFNDSQFLRDLAKEPPSLDDEDGPGIGKIAREKIRGHMGDYLAGFLINFLQMETNDGVELPGKGAMNSFFNFFSDGLPPAFWDVRITDSNQGESTEVKDLVSSDDEPNHYHQQRYNLGPVVYMPLTQKPPKLRVFSPPTKEGTEIASYEESGGKFLRAMGKARIFFRQPSDQWMNRYKVVVTKSLLLPFWQVRNEGMSYVEKWTLLAMQGLGSTLIASDD